MHGLANSLTANGYAKWILNPLGWFGLYPPSYPSGAIFLASGFSQLNALGLEGTNLFMCVIFGLIGLLGAIVLAREIKDDDLFVFLLAAILSLAPRFIIFTLWEVPIRSLFMAITPFFLWSLLRTHRNPSIKNIGLTILFLMILASAHRLALIMLVILLAYIMTYIFLMFMRILRLRFPRLFLKPSFRRLAPTLSIIIVFVCGIFLIMGTGILDSYQKGALISGSSLQITLFNLGVSLARSTGILLPILVFGIIYFAKQKNKGFKEPFLISCLIFLIPTLFLRFYTGFYIITFLAIFISAGIVYLYTWFKRCKKFAKAVIVGSLAVTIVFSSYMIEYQFGLQEPLSAETYNTGIYTRYRITDTTISNDGLLVSRVSAISESPYLPIGGATTVFYGPEMLTFDFYNWEELNIIQIPLQYLTLESDSPFEIIGIQVEEDWAITMVYSVDDISRKISTRYNISYALENKLLWERYTAYGNYWGSKLLQTTHLDRYKIYESDTQVIWYLQ